MGWNDHNTQRFSHRHWDGTTEAGQSSTDQRGIVEGIVDVIRWGTNHAQCVCPACKRTDGILYLNRKFPFLYCHSTGCADHNSRINRELQERVKQDFGDRGLQIELTPEEKAETEWRKHLRKVEVGARNRLLSQLLALPPVPVENWVNESPCGLADHPVESHWKLHVAGLFEQPKYRWQRGLIWIGSLDESGRTEFGVNFKTRDEWLVKAKPYGPQISPCVFKDADVDGSRAKAHVEKRDYFIAESDPKADGTGLTREQFGNVIKWIQKYTTLRAIVDTGGKSLHVWFDRLSPPEKDVAVCAVGEPPERPRTDAEWDAWHKWKRRYDLALARDRRQQERFWQSVDEFFAVLKGLRCDPAMFESLTARLPGWQRRDGDGDLTGRWQRLLYLNPRYSIAL